MKVLLSIKPEYANKIFSGEKKYEFRKSIFKKKGVKTIVVYATMPVGKIIGEFQIKHIHQDKPISIWNKTKEFSGVDEKFFYDYYKDKAYAFAIEVINPILYNEAVNPKEKYKNFVAPQSFKYL